MLQLSAFHVHVLRCFESIMNYLYINYTRKQCRQIICCIIVFLATPTMNVHYYNNLAYSMQFGQPLIVDMGYTKEQKVQELRNLWKQIKECHAHNKMVSRFCNFSQMISM